jgi:long-chain acyl-CoA synthetase
VACSLADATASLNVRRHLSLLPLATLLENIAGIYVPLLLGATTILPACAHSGMSYGAVDMSRLLATISAAEPDSLVLVPELLRMLLHAASRGWRPPPTLKFVAVGGASVSIELLEQADRLGIPVFEGYGLSECASVVCLNTPASRRKGSVGKQLPHAGVRLDERGEICIRGAVMSGYVGGPAVRDEVRSGDLGEMDEDGFLYVRGRLKNLFITSMGRNVAPEWVEREITCEDSIAHAFVAGEARPYAVALLQPSSPQLDATHLDAAVAAANARLPDYARVRRWACFPEAPSHASGLLTANGRLRRAAIQQRHAALIESLYQPA